MTTTEDRVHTPAPGSRIAASQNAAAQAAPDATAVAMALAEIMAQQKNVTPVPVREAASTVTYKTIAVIVGQARQVLGRNDRRRQATIGCTGNNCFLAASQELAQACTQQVASGVPGVDVPGVYITSTTGYTRQILSTEQVWAAVGSGVSGNCVLTIIEESWTE